MSTEITPELAELAVNTIKTLSMDAVQEANSGHPGMPMGAADYSFVLWSRYLKFNPADPDWPDRDRFVLSAGHGSMLLYSLLHLSGYDISIDDIKQFRQWGSRTPGHPEKGVLPGIETTTGPLGQGIANAVGMAIAAKMAAARFNTPDHKIVTHRVFGIAGDGDLMEGISTEAASIAGHLRLDNLIFFYDDNKITIDGSTSLSFSEDIGKKFEAMGWRVLKTDGHDHARIAAALDEATSGGDRPTLIIASTHIAHGSPGKQDTAGSHGAPLGEEEIAATKRNIGWDFDEKFYVPGEVYELFKARTGELKIEYDAWNARFDEWAKANPEKAELRKKMVDKTAPEDLEKLLAGAIPGKPAATRVISGAILQKAAEIMPGLCGGSADLTPSNKTFINDSAALCLDNFSCRNFHFGIREHAMGAVMNGIALYGGFIPYGGTFLVFSDYMRPPIRLSAMMEQQVIFIYTHDSFYVGEDGPTHQPVEQLSALRAIPGVRLFRPADGLETAVAWAAAIRRTDGPTILSLTRQCVPELDRGKDFDTGLIARGGYVISDAENGAPGIVVLAAGSEVGLAVEAKERLGDKGRGIRIVSMPCLELFDGQPEDYRDSVIPPGCDKLVSVEAGAAQCWYKYIGRNGLAISMDRFGASAPGKVLAEKFGFTAESVAKKIAGRFSL